MRDTTGALHHAVQHGTMIVILDTTDGMLLCADKRIITKHPNGQLTTDDTHCKITIINNHTVITAAGATHFFDVITNSTTFNAEHTLADFWRTNDITNPTARADGQHHLLRTFKQYLAALHPNQHPITRYVQGKPILCDIIVGYTADGTPHLADYQLHYDREAGTIACERFEGAHPTTIIGGGHTVQRLLANEHDPTLTSYRNEPSIKLFRELAGPQPPRITTDAALPLAQRLISIASHHEDHPSTISTTSDAIILNNHGITWLTTTTQNQRT